jgi:hypothetical protein
MKVFITRDEDSDEIWLWLKPRKGSFKPVTLEGCDMINFQRRDNMNEIDKYCGYTKSDFKKKFGVPLINKKTCKSIDLPDDLVLDNKLTLSPLIFD